MPFRPLPRPPGPIPAALAAALLLPAGCGVGKAPPPPPDAPAAAAPQPLPPPRRNETLRIGLESLGGRGELSLRTLGPARLEEGATGARVREVPAGRDLRLAADPASGGILVRGAGRPATVREVLLAGASIRLEGRTYPSPVRVVAGEAGLLPINELAIEQYLEGVLPGEIPASFHMEAQKALAVAARSYALAQRGKHGGYDLCDQTCCQVYLGARRGASPGLRAVRATRHQCLWHERRLAFAFYSADCGGSSTRVEDVPLRDKPDEPMPYLRPVRDAPPGGRDYCGASPFHSWTKRFRREELETRLNRRPETRVGTLLDLRITRRDASGRAAAVTLRGRLPAEPGEPGAAENTPPADRETEFEVTGWELRRSVGASVLKSTRMEVDRPGREVYRFRGSGYGHGLGLCQIGANGMAKRGVGFRQILAHYYPDTTVAPLPDKAGLR